MGTRTITFSLDSRSIQKAIDEIERFRYDFERAIQALVEQLTKDGVQFAKQEVISLGAFDTGELEASIYGYYSPSLHAGFVQAGSGHAAFVEYGTGVIGKSNPHPIPAGWAYDVNGHGEAGWFYKSDKDGKVHWTKGQASRPFMYNTYKELQRLFASRAAEAFNSL